MATERSPIKVPCENEDSHKKENATDFDEITLAAISDVYRNQGNEAFRKGDFLNAIHFYTEGIKVDCNDKERKAKLYSNRATAHFKLGNHQDSLRDAKAATELQPTCFKAIVRGAGACVELKKLEEAITWCDKGLAIEKNNKILLSLRLQSVREVGDKSMKRKNHISCDHPGASSGGIKKAINYCNQLAKLSKEKGDKSIEGCAYQELGDLFLYVGEIKRAVNCYSLCLHIAKDVGNTPLKKNAYEALGNLHHRLGDFKKATEYHKLHLKIALEIGNKGGEGDAYGNLGIAFERLGDFKKAIEYHNLRLEIAKEIGYKGGEGDAYGSLGNAYKSLGDFKKAIEYHNRHLETAKEIGDKGGEGNAYGNLGNAYRSLGDFKKAIEYHNLHLEIAKEIGDKGGEGNAYGNLGNVYQSQGDFKKAIEYLNLALKIAKEIGNKGGEGNGYGSLGNAYQSLGDFKKAIEYHNLRLEIAKEIGDKGAKGYAYGNLGNAYQSLGDFKKAIEYNNLLLEIAKEIGDKDGEGSAYCNLGAAYLSLGDFKKAIEYHNLDLEMAKEIGNKVREGGAYGGLGNAFQSLGDFKKAIEYHNLRLEIAKEIGNKSGEGGAYGGLGNAFLSMGDLSKAKNSYNLMLNCAKKVEDKPLEAAARYSLANFLRSLGRLPEAVEHYKASITLYNALRILLRSKDEWKVNFRNRHQKAYTGLWRVLVKQGKLDEALFAAEKGRAQALTDLMESNFPSEARQPQGSDEDPAVLEDVASNTVFQAVDQDDVNLWVVSGKTKKQVQLRQSKLKGSVSENSGVSQSFESFLFGVFRQLGVRSNVSCEDRSLDALRKSLSEDVEKTWEDTPEPPVQKSKCLSTLYDIIMKPVADLVEEDELLIVPDGFLWRVPYAALKDVNSKYLCESFRIRLAPSLTSLRLIAACPEDYHESSGALLVGNPWVAEVTNSKGEKLLKQLPCAEEEVEMIGQLLKTSPITGKQATKREVLKRLSSVSLVHFAAHGCMETGEIALTPDPDRLSTVPMKEDYILTIEEVLNAQLRAKLVVLSCCYSGRGEIKAEGVVGIARAFMGAGARSVVVSLWAIDDAATLEFMKCFYGPLAEGKYASESLNLAMKSLRESDNFSDVKHWAPFLLIGDDVTMDFSPNEGVNS